MDKVTVTLTHHSTKVHSERYDSEEKDPLIRSLYISKSAFDDSIGRPLTITVTVEAA